MGITAIPKMQTADVTAQEMACLAAMMANWDGPQSSITSSEIRNHMRRKYTDAAAGIALLSLERKQLIESFTTHDANDAACEYLAWRLTEKGKDWVLSHKDQFPMTKAETPAGTPSSGITTITDEDIPF